MMTKICTKCGKRKKLGDFARDHRNTDGRTGWCKGCESGYRRELLKDPKRKAAKTRRNRAWRRANPGMVRAQNTRNKYGVTLEQYDEMFEAQDGRCAICGNPGAPVSTGTVRRLCVDHNHTTRRIRGLLCARCNTAIGMLDDNVNHLISAANYLAKNGG